MTKDTPQDKLIDELLSDYDGPDSFWGKSGLFAQIKKRVVERALDAEMDEHLGYAKHNPKGNNSGNSRNGRGIKSVVLGTDEVTITPPRDRNGNFEPQLIPKGKKFFEGFDGKIIAMYARGMSVRDIQSCLLEMYDVDVSEGLISQATNSIMADVKEWQSRPLDPIYPIVFLDCIVVKCRQDGKVSNISVYLALGVNIDGQKELLGIWMSKNEGAKFWLSVVTELRNRGVKDIFIACVDGLKGFPEAIESVFPKTEVQLCIVHMIRNSVRFVNWKDRKTICADLKKIYKAATESKAEVELEKFAEKWDSTYPMISKLWKNHWPNVIPFFDYPQDIRKAIYTTNAIESVNSTLRKIIKTKRSFPSQESVMKIFYLALENIAKKWTMPIRPWNLAMNQFAIKYADRMPKDL